MSNLPKRQSRNMTAAGQSTAQTISSQTAGQRCDKPRQRSREFNSRHSSDKLMTSGSNGKSSGVPAASNNNSKNMKIMIDIISAFLAWTNYRCEQVAD